MCWHWWRVYLIPINSCLQIHEVAEHQVLSLSRKMNEVDAERDFAYLKKPCFSFTKDIDFWKNDDGLIIKNSSFVGIIQLSNTRIHFKPKIQGLDFFHMLPYLKDFSGKSFRYDPDRYIEIKEGSRFIEIIGHLFLNELNRVLKRGLLKKYVSKEENLTFLKGKMILRGQIKNEITRHPKFYCRYFDLTYDHPENQIILSALYQLIKKINDDTKTAKNLKLKLLTLEFRLKNEISLKILSGKDCESIPFNRINEYYKPIISLSRLILNDTFVQSFSSDRSIGVNFLVDMNQLFEDFITAMTDEVIREKKFEHKYEVIAQFSKRAILEPDDLMLRPDIIIKEMGIDPKYPFILDAKYKKSKNNCDYYQLIAYLLAFEKSKIGVLIYPQTEQIVKKDYIVNCQLDEFNGIKKRIYVRKIELTTGDDPKNFINNVKDQIRQIIDELINGFSF